MTYKNFLGPLGGKRQVWAECLFVDPIADIAVFGTPDTQDLYEQADAYDELTQQSAFRLGELHYPQTRGAAPRAKRACCHSIMSGLVVT